MSTVYLLDSNYWIYGMKNYPLDLFPSFWDKMKLHIDNGDVVIHETVLNEINRKDDALKIWFDSLKSYKPMKTSKNILPDYLKIINWAKNAGYTREAITEFEDQSRADAWLCAESKLNNYVLVTNEVRSNSKNKIKIPNVCDQFGIDCINNFNFMRDCQFVF